MTDRRPPSPSSDPNSGEESDSFPDWEALARYVAGESGPREREEIARFLEANAREREVVERLSAMIDRARPASIPQGEIEAALSQMRRRMHKPVVATPRFARSPLGVSASSWISMAAAVTGILAGSLLWLRSTARFDPQSAPAVAQHYRTVLGQADSLRLLDGTRVVLAPQSELIVPFGYGDSEREVELRGAAFFDVVHDDSRPFSVKSGGATIRDIGTVFTVRNDVDGSLRIAVQEGAVLVQREGSSTDEGVLLHEGDLATMAPGEGFIAKRGVVDENESAWTTGRLVFRDASLSDVSSELSRWYGVELQAADSVMASRHLTAEFRGEPLDQIVRELSLALGAVVDRRGDTLVVRSRGR